MNNKSLLRQKAIDVSKLAYSPYSKACVGSAMEMSDGSIYVGCNIENASYGGTICAERVAIVKAVSEGKKEIKNIYVYSDRGFPPCGMCRQFISEFATKDCMVTYGDINGKETEVAFSDLLPYQFTDEYLK